MNRTKALKKAVYIANKPFTNRNQNEQDHKMLNQLFKKYNLNWNEVNNYEGDYHNGK